MFDISRCSVAARRLERVTRTGAIDEDTFLPVSAARRRKCGIDCGIGRYVRRCEKAADLGRNERTTRFVEVENGDFRTVCCE